MLTTFGGRVVEVRSEAAEVLTQEPAPPQDVQSPTAASLKAAREASEPVPPLVDCRPTCALSARPCPLRCVRPNALHYRSSSMGKAAEVFSLVQTWKERSRTHR